MGNFITAQVFSDPRVSGICDKIISTINNYLEEGTTSDFSFYGIASQVFQDLTPPQATNVISFITGKNNLFRVVSEKFPKEIIVKDMLVFKDLIVFSINGFTIEVHKSTKVIATTTISGILCYDYTPDAQSAQPNDPDPKAGEPNYTNPITKL